MNEFYAHGKLLITGEYLVLKGAKALAVPLNKGQTLAVEKTSKKGLLWRAETIHGLWFEAKFNNQLILTETTDHKKATTLQQLLHKAIQQKPTIKAQLNYSSVNTLLEFDPNWGWGSSSTLLHLLQQWLGIDPYRLMDETIGGSGYDIACATANGPIFYRRTAKNNPHVTPATFNPPFIQQMGIVYLNKKQSSSSQIKSFLTSDTSDKKLIEKISNLSQKFTITQQINEFMNLIQNHEELIAEATNLTPVKEQLFSDFDGSVKSLGAWGGDFVLFVSENDFKTNKKWFEKRGYPTVLPYNEVILH